MAFLLKFLAGAESIQEAFSIASDVMGDKLLIHGLVLSLDCCYDEENQTPDRFIFGNFHNKSPVRQRILSTDKQICKLEYTALNGCVRDDVIKNGVMDQLKRPKFIFKIHPIIIGRKFENPIYGILVLYFPTNMRAITLVQLPVLYNIGVIKSMSYRTHGTFPDSRISSTIVARPPVSDGPTYAQKVASSSVKKQAAESKKSEISDVEDLKATLEREIEALKAELEAEKRKKVNEQIEVLNGEKQRLLDELENIKK